jgi:hypothetical protein
VQGRARAWTCKASVSRFLFPTADMSKY